jgi:SAM-dependent methyltransferase
MTEAVPAYDAAHYRTQQAYDHIAGRFSKRWFGDPVMEPFLDRFISLVHDQGTVADIGCGPGRDLAYLLRHGVPTIGIDPSRNMLAEALRNVGSGSFLRADCRPLPLRPRSLAGIWACASLLHVARSELPLALTEFARVLNHGHLFLALKEGEGDEWVQLEADRERFFVYYSLSQVESALRAAGFGVLECIRNEAESSSDIWINFYAKLTT